MAIEHEDGKYHCKFDYSENGRPFRRRIHELVIVANDGRVYRFKGEQLPTSIVGFPVETEDGKHILELAFNRPPTDHLWLFSEAKDEGHVLFVVWSILGHKLALHSGLPGSVILQKNHSMLDNLLSEMLRSALL